MHLVETDGAGRKRNLRALILLSETYADGGIQRFNRTLLTACDILGIECEVLSLADAPGTLSNWTAPPLTKICVFSHRKLRFALATMRAMMFRRYDLVIVGHINLLTLAVLCRMLGRRTWMAMIAHGVEVWSGIHGSRRRALSRLDSILSVSRYTKRRMLEQASGLKDAVFELFPNALSESWRQVALEKQVVPLVKRLPDKFLLSVTRLDRAERYKGIITVLEALPMIADPSIHYVVAGKGNDIEFLQAAAARFGVTDRVHFVGSVSDLQLATLYRQCIAFVLPSGKEGFGIVYLEAMFFRACVIAAREKGAIDVIEHEDTGLLIPYGDTVALKESIDRVVADPAFRRALAVAGNATVVDDGVFTFHAYVGRLANILQIPAPGRDPSVEAPGRSETLAPLDEEEKCA